MENSNHSTEPKLSQSYYCHVDDSGSWLKVTTSDLEILSLTDRISIASFKKGKYAYLEYPNDAFRFIRAWLKANGRDESDFSHFETIVTIHHDGHFSWIKRLRHYKP